MSWAPILPSILARGLRPAAPVKIAVSAPIIHAGQRVFVSIQTGLLADLKFFVGGQRVNVLLGSGEQDGKIRIVPADPSRPNESFSLAAKVAPANKSRSVALIFPAPPGIAPGRHKSVAPEFDYDEQWIEITLPSWRAKPAVAAKTSVTTPPQQLIGRPVVQPFNGLLSKTSHTHPGQAA